MLSISYLQMVISISVVWLIVRAGVWVHQKHVDFKREAVLMLVYICLVVVMRFTFCPFGKVDGHIQPLLFDRDKILPFWLNFEPLVHLFEYTDKREAWLNLIGNTAMFIPLGIVWPAVFKALRPFPKAMAAGVGVSLCIELLQLPFYGRASDIDDLILNSLGFLIGYGIFRLATLRRQRT